MPLPIAETIAELSNSDKPLLWSKLTELSSLNSEELGLWKRSWQAIEPGRRSEIMQRLVELAKENIELNFDSIFRYCLDDPDDEVRSTAIEGLWENEEPSLINPLIELLEQDSSEKVQVAAAIALGKFALLAEHGKLRPAYTSRIEETLLRAVDSTSKTLEVRRRALEAVAPLSQPQVRAAIMEAYQSANHRLIVSSIYAMGKNCDPSWLPILLEELTSTDTEIRFEAAGACGEMEEEDAMPHLISLIDEADIDVQIAAVQALGKIGGTQAKQYLESCLNATSEAIRQIAEQTLNELQTRENPLSI